MKIDRQNCSRTLSIFDMCSISCPRVATAATPLTITLLRALLLTMTPPSSTRSAFASASPSPFADCCFCFQVLCFFYCYLWPLENFFSTTLNFFPKPFRRRRSHLKKKTATTLRTLGESGGAPWGPACGYRQHGKCRPSGRGDSSSPVYFRGGGLLFQPASLSRNDVFLSKPWYTTNYQSCQHE